MKMCLVRLAALFLKHKVAQVAFAEYHSMRNFVECVHAQENQALHKHGTFKSHGEWGRWVGRGEIWTDTPRFVTDG